MDDRIACWQGSGAPGIEITTKMVQAGVRCLWSYDDQADSAAEMVVEIFQAMLESRHQAQRPARLSQPLLSRLEREPLCNPRGRTELIVERLPD